MKFDRIPDNPDLRIIGEYGVDPDAPAQAQLRKARAAITPVTPEDATEHDEQSALMQWADDNTDTYPDLRWLFAIPNGGQRHQYVAAKLKAEGVKSGVPDLFLPVARGGFYGLWIELKRADKTNHATTNQLTWIAALLQRGYQCHICYGCNEAIERIKEYLDAD